jgi:hypothetical protein
VLLRQRGRGTVILNPRIPTVSSWDMLHAYASLSRTHSLKDGCF